MKINKKVRNIGIVVGIVLGLAVGCSSTESTKEDLRTFAITDGKSYQDIESTELGRIYVIPEGKWKVTRLEDGILEGETEPRPEIQKVSICRVGVGNEEITEKRFELEVKEGERVEIMMTGKGMQLYFEEIK